MPDKATLAAGFLALTTIAGCEAMGPRPGQSATVDFGIVQSAEEVTLSSTAVEGALIGGTLGLMFGGDSRAGAAIGGAALGGLAGGAAGGDRTGKSYTVEMPGGSSMRVVTDPREIRVG